MKRSQLLIILFFLSGFSFAQKREDFKTAQKDTFYGKVVDDPYRLLEDTGNSKVQAWMKAENDRTEAFFASMPGRKKLYDQLIAAFNISNQEIGSIRYANKKYYVTKMYPGDDYFKLYEIDEKGNEKVFIDPHKVHPEIKSKNVNLSYFTFSKNSPYMVYHLTIGGYEFEPKMIMRNLETGKEIFDTIYLQRETGIGSFDPDMPNAFYYGKMPKFKKAGIDPTHWWDSISIHHHVMGTDPQLDKLVIGAGNTVIRHDLGQFINLVIEKDFSYALAIVKNDVSNQYRIYSVPKTELNGDATKWKQVTDFDDKVSWYEQAGNYLYLLTQKNAPNSKVLRIDLRDGSLNNATEIIPNTSTLITEIFATKNYLVVSALQDGQGKLMKIAHGSNKIENVALPLKGNVKCEWADNTEESFIVSVTSWVQPKKYYSYNIASGKLEPSIIQKNYGTDRASIEIKEVFVKSHDGVMVPMTILHKKGLKLDGTHPVIMRGYGAYGYNDDPSYWPEDNIFFNMGLIRAIAHVRGGGIYGEAWKEAGRKETKPNTWKDFIACAEYLIAHKYATTKNLVGNGASAGGILIGRAITERPDLFGGAIITVGALDMVRMETSANGRGNKTEFGSVDSASGFKALYEMSSYHHVKNGVKYPAVLLTHGFNDNRVPVWMSAKMAARLQDATASDNPVLLQIDYDSGHGMQQNLSALASGIADRFSFVFWKTGLPGFQPVSR